MTETWQTLADDNYRVTLQLRERHWRSALNRAYYGAYAAASRRLCQKITMPTEREGPHHAKLAVLIEVHLTQLGNERWKVSELIRGLYQLRLTADYYPSRPVTEADARDGVKMMMDLFHLLRERT